MKERKKREGKRGLRQEKMKEQEREAEGEGQKKERERKKDGLKKRERRKLRESQLTYFNFLHWAIYFFGNFISSLCPFPVD